MPLRFNSKSLKVSLVLDPAELAGVIVLSAMFLTARASQAQPAPKWYYCEPARTYYPYVPSCPVPWREIEPFADGGGQSGPAQVGTPPAAEPAPTSDSEPGYREIVAATTIYVNIYNAAEWAEACHFRTQAWWKIVTAPSFERMWAAGKTSEKLGMSVERSVRVQLDAMNKIDDQKPLPWDGHPANAQNCEIFRQSGWLEKLDAIAGQETAK